MKIEYDGIRLDDEFDVLVTDRPLPEFRAEGTRIYGVDGERFDTSTIGTREVKLMFILHNKKNRGLQRDVRRLADILFGARGVHRLELGDERDKDGNQLFRKVAPIGVPELKEYRRDIVQVVRFKMFSPFLYGLERHKRLEPYVRAEIDVGGEYFTWPTARVEMGSNVMTYNLTNLSTGESVVYRSSSGGNTLDIDMEKQTVKSTISGGDGLQIGSRFFCLDGRTSIDGKVRVVANAKTNLSWRERWL